MRSTNTLWISYSGIRLYDQCPRAYELRYLYRNPKTGNRVQIVSPFLSLGSAVHQTIEGIANLPVQNRFSTPLTDRYDEIWKQFKGKAGGFPTDELEREFYQRGRDMIVRVEKDPGPVKNKAIRISMDLPAFWLSESDQIKLCGQIDWLEYLEDQDALHIIDFKTGSRLEAEDSLQLPIYVLLVTYTQKRPVTKVSYWYLEREEGLQEQALPDLVESQDLVLKAAKKVKLARQLGSFKCAKGSAGCLHCRDLERVAKGEGEFVGSGIYKDDLFFLSRSTAEQPPEEDSIIL